MRHDRIALVREREQGTERRQAEAGWGGGGGEEGVRRQVVSTPPPPPSCRPSLSRADEGGGIEGEGRRKKEMKMCASWGERGKRKGCREGKRRKEGKVLTVEGRGVGGERHKRRRSTQCREQRCN